MYNSIIKVTYTKKMNRVCSHVCTLDSVALTCAHSYTRCNLAILGGVALLSVCSGIIFEYE